MPELPLDQVLCGDCLDIMSTLPDKSVHMIFADPPYNLQLPRSLLRPNHSLVDAVDEGWDRFGSYAQYDQFTRAWLGQCQRLLHDEGTIWVIGSYHNIFRVGALMMDLGYWLLNAVHWVKTNPMPNFRGMRFTNATETLIWAAGRRRQKKYTFNYWAMKRFNDDKQMTNVWHLPLCMGAERIRVDGRRAHPTQKPEALLYRVLLASTDPGQIVLDPFFGTGTTGAVARRLKRRFIGIEIDPDYAELARQRIAAVPLPGEPDELFSTPSLRKMPRIAFRRLLEAGYLHPGQKLYTRDGDVEAVVRADAHLSCGERSGSIHRMASLLLGRMYGGNGWEVWHYRDEAGGLRPIDHLRQRWREENGL